MEQGEIKNVSGHGSEGSLSDAQGRVVNFGSSSVIGRDKSSIKTGDHVWFERVGALAINIRKC